jgi:uncharacterized membrane protein YfcA
VTPSFELWLIAVSIGASVVSVIACSCSSAAPYLRERLTNIRLALVLETAVIPCISRRRVQPTR